MGEVPAFWKKGPRLDTGKTRRESIKSHGTEIQIKKKNTSKRSVPAVIDRGEGRKG